MIIYRIVNKLNGHCYIGQTTKTLEELWAEHCLPSSKCYALSAAIKKYGKSNFSLDLIQKYNNRTELNNAEEYYIDFYNCLAPNGYNLTTGGYNTSLSETSRRKSSLTHKMRFSANLSPWLPKKGESRSPNTQFKKGRVSNRLGAKLSEETKNKISLSKKGRKKQFIDGIFRFVKV